MRLGWKIWNKYINESSGGRKVINILRNIMFLFLKVVTVYSYINSDMIIY